MAPKDLADFGQAVSKMTKLESLRWDVSYTDDWHTVLGLWHRSLPELWSLSLVISADDWGFSPGISDKVEALTNLRELSIRFGESVYQSIAEETPTRVVDLIRGASNLQSLSLEFGEEEDDFDSWKPSDLFSALSQEVFPSLHSIRVTSQALIPIESPDEPEFRRFLQRHPQLRTIILNTFCHDPELEPEVLVVDPNEMASLMPSVKHFEGPCVVFEALLGSDLAKQVETLGLIGRGAPGLDICRGLLLRLSSSMSQLSCLKRLKIYGCSIRLEVVLIQLLDIVRNTPVLEDLILDGSTVLREESSLSDNYLRLLGSLSHLRTLVIPKPPYSSHSSSAVSEDSQAFFLRAGTLCPLLGSIHLVSTEWEGRWDIIRQQPEGSPSDVVYTRKHGRSIPSGWDESKTCDELLGPSWRQDTFCGYDTFYLSYWDGRPLIH